jgi:sugar phosphate isomerase/epimerase
MERVGLECLSVFGLHPVEIIRLAAKLGCGHVSLNLGKSANRLPEYPECSIRHDSGLRQDIIAALADHGVGLSLLEGFALTPDNAPQDLAAHLDIAAELGARAVCVVSIDRDLARTHDSFARLAAMAGERGLLLTTEVGAGVMRRLSVAMEAVRHAASPHFALLIDTMHFFRSGATVADLTALDPAMIGHVQLCDVPMPAEIASYMEEALYERRCPGDGDLPLREFLKHVPAHVPIGLEVPIRSEEEAGITPSDRLHRCTAAAQAMLATL